MELTFLQSMWLSETIQDGLQMVPKQFLFLIMSKCQVEQEGLNMMIQDIPI